MDPAIEALIVRMARENSSWGYDRIAGALANLGHRVSDQTIGNILKRHGIAPAPKRSQNTTWKDFIAAHMAVLCGADFFTVEVLTWRGLVNVLCPVLSTPGESSRHSRRHHTASHRSVAHSDGSQCGLRGCRYVLHDRDANFCAGFDDVLASEGIHCLKLPPRSPNLNAFAERWVRSVKVKCLSKPNLFGESSPSAF